MIRVGCAGWSLPRAVQPDFAGEGSHLQRYANRLNAAEINSSFWRAHARATYERWAASVPPDFRFSVKLPRAVTHERRLVDCDALLGEFMAQACGLGAALDTLLVQLPPSLAFDAAVARRFFTALRRRHAGAVAVEPRHAGWFCEAADSLMRSLRLSRVLADPVLHSAWPGGWPQRVYLRLHGSPRVYYSAYEPALIEALARRLRRAVQDGAQAWCIFDNTASGAAAHNALQLTAALHRDDHAAPQD